MKKRVAFLLVFVLFSSLALAQLDLPAPPPVPGAQEAQEAVPKVIERPSEIEVPPITAQAAQILESLPTNISAIDARLEVIEGKLQVVDLIPSFEERLNEVEQQAALAAQATARLDALESEIDALKVEVRNIKQRPLVDRPTFTGGISAVQSSVKKSSLISISISLLTLVVVVSLILYMVYSRRKSEDEQRELLAEYVRNYSSQGYGIEELRAHLLASGWDEKLVDSAISRANV
ncbi:hypothetical protein D6825_03840 [Candidatus Woesearchaeota archaeon]|nr:MAG: hypothetical protein D6825_03840 [Candidatus Woesearchaeota archaeon]